MEIVKAIKNKDFNSFKNLISTIDNIENGFSLFERGIPRFSREFDDDDDDDDNFPASNLSLLHVSAYFNSLECFKYLQNEKQLSLRLLSQKGYLPLHYACYNGSTEVALYILNEDPEEPFNQGKKKFSLLYCASLGHNKTIIEELFNKGDKLSSPWNDEYEIIRKIIGLHNDEIFFLFTPQLSKDYDQIYKDNRKPYSIIAAINHNVSAFELLFRKEDLDYTFIDRSGYHSIISIILETDQRHIFREILLKILVDVKDKNIEPPDELQFQEGVCHWACLYNDFEIAKILLNTKDVKINRFGKEHTTGPFKLIERKGSQVVDILRLLVEHGFDINLRYNEKSPTLLEGFLTAISKNYQAISFLVDYGADVNAFHSRETNREGESITLYEFVKAKGDRKTKEIFNI